MSTHTAPMRLSGCSVLGEHPSAIVNCIAFALSYVWHVVTTTMIRIYFGWPFNRLRIIGKEHVRSICPNTLMVSNHISSLDSWIIGSIISIPRGYVSPYRFPWHVPEIERLPSGRVGRWLFFLWKCIPISRNKVGHSALKIIEKKFATGIVHIFPNGTRERPGVERKARGGVGWLIARQHKMGKNPWVLPVHISGYYIGSPDESNKKRWFRNEIIVAFGKPFQPDATAAMERITEMCMDAIESLSALN